jgi:hypothetical protein
LKVGLLQRKSDGEGDALKSFLSILRRHFTAPAGPNANSRRRQPAEYEQPIAYNPGGVEYHHSQLLLGGPMSALRMQFLSIAVVVFIGIYLTGFSKVHWFLYVPIVVFLFAGITGICPGLMLWKKLGFKG